MLRNWCLSSGLEGQIRALFAAGEQGAWYDPPDLSASFQDSAGTTAVYQPGQGSADPPVGLLLDKRLGLVLVEKVTVAADRDFSSDTGFWTRDPGQAIGGGTMNFTATGANNGFYRASLLATGDWCEVTFTISSYTSGSVKVYLGATVGTVRSAAGTYTERVFMGSANTSAGIVAGGAGTTLSIDNVSFKLVSGNHALQATAASRPVLSGRKNQLVGTDVLSTQSVTVVAASQILSFTGTGTITLSGVSTAGPLVGTGPTDRVSLTFVPTAGSLTLTVTGSVTLAQLELGV